MYILKPYDDALHCILQNGELRPNRTGVDCLTVFSLTSTYRIDERFPLLTKRRLFPKAVFAELLWMLSGSTNNDDLIKTGANFWTPWVEPGHPDNDKFYRETGFPVGYLGPVYGWQMRHFGKDYKQWLCLKRHGLDAKAMDEGFDQISWLVNEIKTNPNSRRLIVSMWNPRDMHLMRLAPCHFSFHVLIGGEKKMSLLVNQRSCDFPVGVPANIQFYSALCYMLAQQTGYTPYQLIHHAEDAHIYVSQLDQVKEYLSRDPRPSPTLKLLKADNIFDYLVKHFVVEGYDPHPAIKMSVEV